MLATNNEIDLQSKREGFAEAPG
uniref:Uncharacterized protein n=1 Tax=Anguilla anguilla TaxID=7936 RepID=A0A0E9T3A9_ANGAN